MLDKIKSVKQKYGIVGNSDPLNHAIQVAIQVAPTDMTVLINGESGSGKESFSKIIHWLIYKFYRPTIFFLGGLMLGALNKVWPWQLDNKIVLPEGDILMSFIIFILSGIISYNLKSE